MCLSGCVLRVARWDRVLGEGGVCVDFCGAGCRDEESDKGKKKQENRREKVHILKTGVLFLMKLVLKRLLS